MIRRYVFGDDADCLTFARKPGVSRFFIICTVTMTDCTVGDALLALRRQLAWDRAPLGDYFHASSDKQSIRDAVFRTIGAFGFDIQATVLEKSKANDALRSEPLLTYRYAWYAHLGLGVVPCIPTSHETLLSVAAIGTRRERLAFGAALDSALRRTMSRHVWRSDFLPAHSDPCVQVADYCAWAIQRRWETQDSRSYDLIADRITHEHDLWETETKFYY